MVFLPRNPTWIAPLASCVAFLPGPKPDPEHEAFDLLQRQEDPPLRLKRALETIA